MKIKAAVLNAIGEKSPYAESKPLSIEEIDLAAPGHGEVLVRVSAAGLCHSDLSVINGDRPRPMPMALGHEAAGVVESLGEGIADLQRGDHVVLVFVPSCGHCGPCSEGRPALCEPGAAANGAGTLLSGARRLTRNGEVINHHLGCSVFAEYATVSRHSLVKIDPELPLDEAALFGCAVLTGVGAVVNTAQVRAGASVAAVSVLPRCWARARPARDTSSRSTCRMPNSNWRHRSAPRMPSMRATPTVKNRFASSRKGVSSTPSSWQAPYARWS